MCGIVGFWNRDGAPVNLRLLQSATQRQRHRGPDDEGYLLVNTRTKVAISCAGEDTNRDLELPPISNYYHEHFDLAFGFRRLAILDLSSAGHQPMASHDQRQWIVYNGEIYNFIELRQTLEGLGYSFRSDTDTEVVLSAYQHWGEDCVNHFNGMWAFAIWDQENHSIFLSRDRFGIKPLYYVDSTKLFAFASEPKALIHFGDSEFQPNERMIFQYILGGILPDPREKETFFSAIHSLPASHKMRVAPEKIHCRRYWSLQPDTAQTTFGSAGQSSDEFRELLIDSIRLRMRSDVPIGTCLSGGLDSSSIVGVVNQLLDGTNNFDSTTQRRHTQTHQSTFSAVYESKGRYNERPYIETMLASHTDIEGHFVFPSVEQLWTQLEQLVWHQDEPFLSTSIFAQWCVMQEANTQGIRILLDGQGADEILAGYQPYAIYLKDQLRSGTLSHFFTDLRTISAISDISQRVLLQEVAKLALPEQVFVQLRSLNWRLNSAYKLFEPSLVERYKGNVLSSSETHQHTDLSQRLLFRLMGTLPHLLRYEDRNSMAHSIESRIPFLDYRIVEYTFQQGSPWRIHDGWTKWLLRKSMEEIVPTDIVWRRDKVGFETPQNKWLPKLIDVGHELFAHDSYSAEFLDQQEVRRRLAEWKDEKRPNQSLVWRLINLEMWLRTWHKDKMSTRL